MNDWKCPKCDALNDEHDPMPRFADCDNCGARFDWWEVDFPKQIIKEEDEDGSE